MRLIGRLSGGPELKTGNVLSRKTEKFVPKIGHVLYLLIIDVMLDYFLLILNWRKRWKC